MRRQGLRLLVVELAFDDQPFVLTDEDADILIRQRTRTVLWHKERLLNIGIENLPGECDSVCWLDSDVIFANDDWVAQTREALGRAPVVQPFRQCIWLPPDCESVEISNTNYPATGGEFGRHHGFAFGWKHFGVHALPARILFGHVGFAWAARRPLLERIGLYDRAVAGSGDNLMAHAFVGNRTFLEGEGRRYPVGLLNDYVRWADRAHAEVRGRLDYAEGILFHLWHGTQEKRQYATRHRMLARHGYDPDAHIELDEGGVYRWTERVPPEMIADLRKFFVTRREDALPPPDIRRCRFKAGFYDEEDGFRWAASKAVLEIGWGIEWLPFRLGNNVLRSLGASQSVRMEVNGVHRDTVRIDRDVPVDVRLEDLKAGDELCFESDFEFCPETLGGSDTRRLSFMMIYRPS